METESAPPSLESLRSRIRGLRDVYEQEDDAMASSLSQSDLQGLLNQCVSDFESRAKGIVSECSNIDSLGVEDLDLLIERLKEELNAVEMEDSKISTEIEALTERIMAESNSLESNLAELENSLDLIASRQNLEGEIAAACMDASNNSPLSLVNSDAYHNFEMLSLQSQIEEKEMFLMSLQHLEWELKKYEAIEQIEDMLTGLKVIAIDGNCIRLSLKTYVPIFECYQEKMEDTNEISDRSHELMIEVVDEDTDFKTVEIFPNDIYIADIVDAAKSSRRSSSQLVKSQATLEWFVRKVQERVILSTLRRFMVKKANKSRHSSEYLDKDEIIIAHMVGGIDAYIKLPQGWPLINKPLKLASLQSTNSQSEMISLSYFCKVEDVNSIDESKRVNLSCFLDAIEKKLIEQTRLDLHSKDLRESAL